MTRPNTCQGCGDAESPIYGPFTIGVSADGWETTFREMYLCAQCHRKLWDETETDFIKESQ